MHVRGSLYNSINLTPMSKVSLNLIYYVDIIQIICIDEPALSKSSLWTL